MAAQSVNDVVEVEIEQVNKRLHAVYEKLAPFWAGLKRSTTVKQTNNRDFRYPIQIRPGGRFRFWDPDGGTLGPGGGQKYEQALIKSEHVIYAVEWTWLTKWDTNTKRKAVVDAVRNNLKDAASEYARQLDSLVIGDNSPILAKVLTASSTSQATHTLTFDTIKGSRRLRAGQRVLHYSVGGTGSFSLGTRQGVGDIVWVDPVGRQAQIKLTADGTFAAGDVLLVEGSGTGNNPTTKGFYGIQYHMSNAATGTWLGIDRASNPEIRGNRVDGGGAFELGAPRKAINMIGNRLGKEGVKKMKAWMHKDMRDVYEGMGQLISSITKQPKKQGLDLYFQDDLQLAGSPIMTHFSWDTNRIDFIPDGVFERVELFKSQMLKQKGGGHIWNVYGDGSDGSDHGYPTSKNISYMAGSWNLMCVNPACTAYIDNL